MRRMVIDTPNVLFRVAASNSRYNEGTPEEKAGLAMHVSLNVFLKFYKKFRPQQLAVVFEGSQNWRKTHTKTKSVSGVQYKANRVKDPSMEPFFELIKSFEELVRHHTSLICLSHPMLEGDDCIAGFCQKYTNPEDEIIVISGDKDMTQLLKQKNVQIYTPDDKIITHEDPDFYMFEKCFRGDKGDNVPSAYPHLRTDKIKAAYTDELLRQNLFNHVLQSDEDGNPILHVKDLWKENELLMDLTKQPEEIRAIMKETVDREVENHGKFDFFFFNKFLGKYRLQKIAEQASNYVDLFNATYKNSEFKEQNKNPTKSTAKSLLSF